MKNKFLRFLSKRRYRVILTLSDIFCICIILNIASFLSGVRNPSAAYYVITIITWLIFAHLFLLYSVWRYALRKAFYAIFCSWITLNVLTFYFGIADIKRIILLWMFPVFLIFIMAERVLFKSIIFYVNKGNKGAEKRAVILGVGKEAKKIADEIKATYNYLYKIVGFIKLEEEDEEVDKEKILGDFNSIYNIIKKQAISEIIIAASFYTNSLDKKIREIIKEHSELNLSFKITPYLYDKLLGKFELSFLPHLPLFDINPKEDKRVYFAFKRLFDILVSFFILVVLCPVFMLITVVIKFYDKGPVFYKQKRLGIDGRLFILYKFRSMVIDAEKDTGPIWAQEKDTRVTPIGHFLRKTSLDELPQFFNVLCGSMSLIGPRPERPYFVEKHKELQGKRMNVKPGLTGLAQINGRYDLNIRHKAKYDYIYLKNCSFGLDLKILAETFWVVAMGRGVR